jgi:hypothetical protein
MNTRIRSTSGFTVIEVAVSLAVLAMIFTTVFSITVETARFLSENDTSTTLQLEGQRSMERLTEILRKTGRTTVGGVTYPRVVSGGTGIEFLVLTDIDGNGYPFQASNGDLEWDPTVYTAGLDPNGNFGIFDAGGNQVYALGRFINNLSFETIAENASIHFREIRVSFDVRGPAISGYDMVFPFSGSIHMRN